MGSIEFSSGMHFRNIGDANPGAVVVTERDDDGDTMYIVDTVFGEFAGTSPLDLVELFTTLVETAQIFCLECDVDFHTCQVCETPVKHGVNEQVCPRCRGAQAAGIAAALAAQAAQAASA